VSDLRRQANVLGALALVISDRVDDAVTERSGVSSTAAVALSALYHFLDRPTIDLLRQVLGLTSSGAVRLVDRLVEAGYVERRPGEDRRSTAVTLTRKGRRVAERVAQARESVLGTALSQLSPEERDCLDALMAKLSRASCEGPGRHGGSVDCATPTPAVETMGAVRSPTLPRDGIVRTTSPPNR